MQSVLAAFVTSVAVSSVIMLWDHQRSEEKTQAVVEKVINENPEMIMTALREAQVKKREAMVKEVAKKFSLIEQDLKEHPDFPVGGNPNGDVTVTEFFDYHCGYCKHFAPMLKKVTEDDPNVRVVFKDFPILSEDSVTLAKAALAINHIDPSKYYDFYMALMESKGNPTPEMLTELANNVGVDPQKFVSEMNDKSLDDEINRNKELAKQLSLNFTPAILVGNKLMQGNPNASTLETEIASARSTGPTPH